MLREYFSHATFHVGGTDKKKRRKWKLNKAWHHI